MRVAIIGAGITGLYLGWKLSEKGHKITVFEKKGEIGQEVCSGLFSERILKFIPESRKLIQNKIDFVLLHFPQKIVKINFSKDFFVMSHFELDKLVADLAQRAGAKIVLNQNVSELPQGYDKIIGCDGANSFIRRSLGLPEPKYRLGIQGFVKKKSPENFVETWPVKNGFTPLEIPGKKKKYKESKSLTGFIWKIPRANEIEYGIISNPKNAKKILDDFLKKNNIFLEGLASKIVPQGLIIPENPSITLCGDAAGLTKPWSGGGVVWGLTAAKILLENFPDFSIYQKRVKKIFAPKIIFSKIAVKLIYFFGFKLPWLLPKITKMESDFLV